MTMTTVSTTAYAGEDKDDSCAKKDLKDGKNIPPVKKPLKIVVTFIIRNSSKDSCR
jgi:hypothetical protein